MRAALRIVPIPSRRMSSTAFKLDSSMIDEATSKMLKFPAPRPTQTLSIAAAHGDLASLEGASGTDLDTIDEHGNSPLIWAANYGHQPCVAHLVQSGVDVNVRGYLGATAISRACRYGHLSVVQTLLSSPNIDPNIPNKKLQYPLHFAAFQEHTEVVVAMLGSGHCDPAVTDRKCRTPAEDTKNEEIRDMITAASFSDPMNGPK